MGVKIVTPKFRASYPALFEPKLNDLNGKDEYSVVALFKKGEDLSGITAAIKSACEAKWGKDAKKWPKKIRTPLRDQSERAKEDDEGKTFLPDGYEAGAMFTNLKTDKKPDILNGKKEIVTDESDVYAGCYLRAQVDAFAYEHKGNTGVSLRLLHIQKVGDGPSLGGGRGRAVDAFTEIDEVSDDSTADSVFG